MVARRSKPQRRKPVFQAWEEGHAKIFPMADATWTTPSKIQLSGTTQRLRATGIFVGPKGDKFTLTTVLRRRADGSGMEIGEQMLRVRYRWRPV